MRYLFSILLLTFSFSLQAEMVARDQVGNWVKLGDEACAASQWMQKDWKKAEFFYEGRQYKACWRLVGPQVFLLDAAGDVTVIPAQFFNRETGA